MILSAAVQILARATPVLSSVLKSNMDVMRVTLM